MFEYPPYISKKLPGSGITVAYLNQFLKKYENNKMGQVSFVSFSRMLKTMDEESNPMGFIV